MSEQPLYTILYLPAVHVLHDLYAHPQRTDDHPEHCTNQSGIDNIQQRSLLKASLCHIGYDKEPRRKTDDGDSSGKEAELVRYRCDWVDVGFVIPSFAEFVGKVVTASNDNSRTCAGVRYIRRVCSPTYSQS